MDENGITCSQDPDEEEQKMGEVSVSVISTLSILIFMNIFIIQAHTHTFSMDHGYRLAYIYRHYLFASRISSNLCFLIKNLHNVNLEMHGSMTENSSIISECAVFFPASTPLQIWPLGATVFYFPAPPQSSAQAEVTPSGLLSMSCEAPSSCTGTSLLACLALP